MVGQQGERPTVAVGRRVVRLRRRRLLLRHRRRIEAKARAAIGHAVDQARGDDIGRRAVDKADHVRRIEALEGRNLELRRADHAHDVRAVAGCWAVQHGQHGAQVLLGKEQRGVRGRVGGRLWGVRLREGELDELALWRYPDHGAGGGHASREPLVAVKVLQEIVGLKGRLVVVGAAEQVQGRLVGGLFPLIVVLAHLAQRFGPAAGLAGEDHKGDGQHAEHRQQRQHDQQQHAAPAGVGGRGTGDGGRGTGVGKFHAVRRPPSAVFALGSHFSVPCRQNPLPRPAFCRLKGANEGNTNRR